MATSVKTVKWQVWWVTFEDPATQCYALGLTGTSGTVPFASLAEAEGLAKALHGDPKIRDVWITLERQV